MPKRNLKEDYRQMLEGKLGNRSNNQLPRRNRGLGTAAQRVRQTLPKTPKMVGTRRYPRLRQQKRLPGDFTVPKQEQSVW